MKKLSLVALLVILSACKSQKGDAIHAQVLLPSVNATCVRFEVRDPTNDQPLQTRWLTRSRDDLQIAIYKGSLPETVRLAARPYRDGDCTENAQEAPIPNGPYKTEDATFLKDGITQASLQLEPGTDGDGDGYVATGAGGADCQDAPGQGEVHPGAEEQCTDQTDRNCDNKKGCEVSACGPNACIGPPTNLVLTVPTSTVQSGTCTSASIQVKDASSRDTTVSTATVVGLEATPTSGIVFFANPACTTQITSVDLAVGQGGATFYFQGQVVGDVTVSATAGSLQDSKVAHLVPGPGNRLVFTSSPQTVTAGTCSTVVFQSQNAQGGAVPVTAATAVSLAASPATGFRFYSDAGCNNEVTSVNIPAGMSVSGFRFKGTKSGTVAVTLTAAGFTGSSQNETITAGPPTAMVFTGPPTLPAGDCSAPVTIELRDSFDNPATATSTTNITLVSSGVALTYSTNSGCSPTTTSVSIAPGASTTSFRYRGTAAGTTNISGTATGLTTRTPLGVTITPGAPSVLAFTTTAQTRTAGNCSSVVTVQLRDGFGNAIRVGADTPVALSAAPPTGFQFFMDSNCASAVTSVNIPTNGSDANFFFKGTSVGTGTVAISAAVTGVPTATQNVTLNPGPPTVLAFSQPSVTMAAGACTQITLFAQDTFGNPSVVGSNQLITFTPSPSTGFTFSANTDCSSPGTTFNIFAGQSSRVLYMRGTVATDVTVTASRSGFTSGTLTVKVNPGVPNKLFFLTAPQTTVLVGSCSGITTVQVQDSFDNPTPVAANTQIDLSSNSSGGMVFYSDAACTTPATFVTVPAGQNSASFYFKDSNAETVMITAASTGLTSANQTETINPLPPTALVFTTSPQTVAATGCSGITTVETWAGGTPTTVITSTTVNLGANPPTGFTFYSNSNCTTVVTSVTIAVGQGSAIFYFKGATPGTVTITASSSGLTSDTQNETITTPPTKLLFTTPARTTVAGDCSAVVTVQPADASNNPVPVIANTTVNLSQSGTPTDAQFKFYSDASCGTQVTSVTIPARQNFANLYYKGQVARTVTLMAAATGLTSATQDNTMVAGNAAALVFAPSTPAQTLLAGTCSNLRTVETRDAFGNVATNGATVTFSGSTTAEFFQDLNCVTPITGPVTIPAGNSTTGFYFKGFTGGINANGTLTLTASATGLTNGTQAETIIPTVRTGSCTMPNTSVTCSITPALLDVSKAFLVFQATSDNVGSDRANVRCFLSSLSQVTCERQSNGGSDVKIRWSVAEFPSSVGVQHQAVDCGGDVTPVSLSNVAMGETFLLLSSYRDGTNQGSAVPRLAVLTTATGAEIRKTGGCSANDHNHIQAVTYAGASVQRGLTSLTNGNPSAQVNLAAPVTPGRSVALYSYISDGSGVKICDRVLRGELTGGGSSVTFSRGEGDTVNCAGSSFTSISWQVIEFPPGTVVQQVTQPLVAGASGLSATTSITAVDLSRTLVIGGGQWASGQVHGEGKHSSSELISEMRAQAYLTDSTTLNFSRETSNNTAKFTAYVVQFKP